MIITILVIISGVLLYGHFDYYEVPQDRLALTETYPEMKEDSFHHYINFQIDYKDPSVGKFRGFYLLSPHFYEHKNVTFLLTDGQMELVNTTTDFGFFEEVLGNNSYVLIGVRGHSPTHLPEVYKNGEVDYTAALNYYNSDQQVEDIEMVRLDLIKKGLIEKDNKINVFGASGAGILAQQYISKYGANVQRVILESTGAPDLSKKKGWKYSPDFAEFNPEAAAILSDYLDENVANKAFLCNILYQLGRTENKPRNAQLEIVKELQDGSWLLKYKFKASTNLKILNYLIKAPKSIAARIRWFELVGHDLINYDGKTETNLLYELSLVAISDVLNYFKNNDLTPREFSIKRDFAGEVLILKGTEDVVFGDSISLELQKSYPNAKILFFNDGHKFQKNKTKYRQIRTEFLTNGFEGIKHI